MHVVCNTTVLGWPVLPHNDIGTVKPVMAYPSSVNQMVTNYAYPALSGMAKTCSVVRKQHVLLYILVDNVSCCHRGCSTFPCY